MSNYEADLDACRSRQGRLIDHMQENGIDAVIVTQTEHVQWLAGPRFPWVMPAAAALRVDGHLTLASPKNPALEAAADEVVTYEAQWHSTLRNDQRQACMHALEQAVGEKLNGSRLGVEFSCFGRHGNFGAKELVDVEPTLYRLRRRKHADELARIRKAIAGTRMMYERAREILRPGLTELEMFNQLQATAVEEFGEMLTGTGNDYQCGSRGGPPRDGRAAEAGELYILDLGPAFRGYFADNCRTIAVTQPSEVQQEAWSYIMKVFEHVERTVKPGKNAQELFHEAQAILDQAPTGVFNHHLGHGIGLFPHEAPHLNPNWNDTFEEGDVFTAEPGLYAPELRAGMRIENDYLVTADGVELLTPFRLELSSM
ncbi:MAG: Xaa-Pro peptidase family protein [Planctomycetota bacterium]|nr:Xaa-Pro peptidase family protein [Planctomycetota bacterium]